MLGEVAATLSLKAALDEPAWYALVVTGHLAAFALLAAVPGRGTPMGIAYGVRAAHAVVLTALGTAAPFGERLSLAALVGIVFVVTGVPCVETGSHRPVREREEAA
ncbi:MAG: QacE family quaternary ammonium compound efflux transporter [Citricoccus sp.]|nr:QacE family quaternary ammonium compound efflux transporter [Citricoccus sp. WCRC_4]